MTTVVCRHSILVHAPLQRAFAYVSDLTRHPEWSSGKLTIEAITPGPVAIGKEYFSRGEAALQKDRPNQVRITEYQPPRRFAFIANDPAAGEIMHEFIFTEQKEGVRIERVMTLSLNPLLAFLFRLLVYPFIGSPSMNKSLGRLKEKLETG